MTRSMVKPHVAVVSVLISESQNNCHGQIIVGEKEKKKLKVRKTRFGSKS